MNVFEILDQESRAADLPFLIIGGHAVNAYGYSRLTKDLDLLIRKTDRDTWLKILTQRDFTVFRDEGTFLQFSPPQECR